MKALNYKVSAPKAAQAKLLEARKAAQEVLEFLNAYQVDGTLNWGHHGDLCSILARLNEAKASAGLLSEEEMERLGL